MPDLASFPKSQRVTFKYYEGVLFFLEENYVEVLTILPYLMRFNCANTLQAEKHLTEAWTLCHKDAKGNQE
jgi:COP9 signalosome complex subunit 12